MNYKEALAYLEGLNRFGIRLGLSRIKRLLELLGLPQERYRTIHITGTNGKGSVSSILATIMQCSSIHAGLYTSPHLVSYTERIQVDGQPISEKDFANCLAEVRTCVDQMVNAGDECPTEFEVMTAMAFLWFAKCRVEYAVVEVGLGGLLDSTNVIEPEVSVITNVTMEHADRCGGTLEGIARHKAGIIKDGIPVVTAAKGMPLDVIRQTAEEKNADVFVAGEDFQAKYLISDGRTQSAEFTSDLLCIQRYQYKLHLLGMHQIENSSVAIITACLLHNEESRITEKTIREALEIVTWPARFERVDLGDQIVLIDGAHNPDGIRVLRESLDTYFPDHARTYLLGILRDKAIDAMLDNLLRPEDEVVVCAPHSERADNVDDLARRVKERGVLAVATAADYETALNRALRLAGENRILVIAGSLYLVGGIRQMVLDMKEGSHGRDES